MSGGVDFGELEVRLGHVFREGGLLERALRLRAHGRDHNDALEFLGDRVLGLSLADMLYERLGGDAGRVGEFADRLNWLASGEYCARVGVLWGLEAPARQGAKKAVAGMCEAVLGALWLDGGWVAARGCVERWWGDDLGGREETGLYRDAKTLLQERVHKMGGGDPLYETTGREGPDHAPRFRVRALAKWEGGELSGEGEGGSLKEAELIAAAECLRRLVAEAGA